MVLTIIVLSVICIFNITMWIVFGVKFKKVFSTDKILQRTRDSLNNMLIEINRNAERNITLIDERIKTLKAVSSEADRHVMAMEKELEKMRVSASIQKQYYEPISLSATPMESEKKTQNKSKGNVNPLQKYVKEQKQGSLFSSEELKSVQQEKKTETEKETVVKFLPASELLKEKSEEKIEPDKKNVGVPEFTVSKDPVVPKKSLNESVKELYLRGETPESIAKALEISLQEVNFSLEFSND